MIPVSGKLSGRTKRSPVSLDISALAQIAQRIRWHCLRMTSEAGSGHPTSCLSAAEIMSVLFFHEMRYDPASPHARDADVFVLSKGHAAPVLYAALKEAGAIAEDLLTLRRFDSPLEGHPTPLCPWVRVATGSLGQGLSAAAGMAYARKLDGKKGRVYVLLGDGETAEGAVWEAAQFASHYRLDNLCAAVDVNALGQSGPTLHEHDLESLKKKFLGFGWEALIADGHDVRAIIGAFERARKVTERPSVVLARTVKGKGVSWVEGKDGWHGKPLKKGEELDRALEAVGFPEVAVQVSRRAYDPSPSSSNTSGWSPEALEPQYSVGHEVATREAYGKALVKLGKILPTLVVLDGDVKNSTYAQDFRAAFPDRYVECYIAEQNMVGAALGMATEGKVPFASSFACFLTRAHDFLRMAAYSRPRALVVCGSHAGVSIGEDGPSQMGLEDIAMMRGLFGSKVLYPCDAVSTERLVAEAIRAGGIVYLRTTRPKTAVIYAPSEKFPVGGSKTLRSSPKDRATIVAAGITVFEALQAYEALSSEGISVRVIDAYSVKPLDETTLLGAARETGAVVTVEDHSVHGGLGEAVSALLAGRCRVELLGIREIPRSGKPEELLEQYGISAKRIAGTVRKLLKGREN